MRTRLISLGNVDDASYYVQSRDDDTAAPYRVRSDCLTDEDVCRVWRVATVRAAMSDLLTPVQYGYLADHIAGMSYTDIAAAAGVDPSTVSRTCGRARARLARYMIYGVSARSTADVLTAADIMRLCATQ